MVIIGKIKSIDTKSGTNDKGKWYMKIVELEDGTKHSTFDKLPESWSVGSNVKFENKMKGKYSNIVKVLNPAQSVSQPEPNQPEPNKMTLGLEEKIPHPSGANYSSKSYTAMYSLNTDKLDPQKADAIMEILQGVIDRKKELDKHPKIVSHKETPTEEEYKVE